MHFHIVGAFFPLLNSFINLSFQLHTSLITQSCPTICNPLDCSLLGSSVHGIFQAILEWVSFSRESSRPLSSRTHVFCVSPALQADPLPAEPLRKSKCSISTLQKKKNKNNYKKLIYIRNNIEKFP